MLGVRRHAVSVLANATGHQLSCTFGSVLSFLGTISQQHHHHGWGRILLSQHPTLAFYTCTEQTFDKQDLREGTDSSQRGSTALLHVGGVAEIPSGLPCSSWLCSCTLRLAPRAPAPDTCECQRLCCLWEQLSTCSVLRHHHPPSQTPLQGCSTWERLFLGKAFLPSFHFMPHVSGNGRRQNGVCAFGVLLFSVALLNVAGDNPNSSSAEFFKVFLSFFTWLPSSSSVEMWEFFTSSSSFTGSH